MSGCIPPEPNQSVTLVQCRSPRGTYHARPPYWSTHSVTAVTPLHRESGPEMLIDAPCASAQLESAPFRKTLSSTQDPGFKGGPIYRDHYARGERQSF